MKKLLLVLLGLGSLSVLFSQQKTMRGIICFTEVSKLELKIEGDASQFSHALPNEIKSEKELLFNEEAALYRKHEQEESVSDMVGGEDESVRIVVNEPDNILFTDLSKGTTVEQKEFMTRMFLIDGKVNVRSWKLTGNQMEILGFPCQEATSEEDSVLISAWFTPAIPVSAGPGGFGGLPGMILLVDAGHGERVIRAEKIEFRDISAADLQKPKKGKAVTKDEFRAMVDEKMKEIGASGGGGSHMMTIQIKR